MTKMYGILSASCLATVARSQDEKLLAMGLSTIFKTKPGQVAHGWDVLTSVQVAEHAACFDNIDNSDESCDAEDQAENLQQIAQGALFLLSLTKFPVYLSVLRSHNDIDNMMLGIKRRRSFDAWYQATQKHLDENGPTPEENEFHPATPDEIAAFLELLGKQPEEQDFQEFMILYDKLLDWIFARYYAIAKSEDGDGNDDTLYGKNLADAQEAFTLHNFLYPTKGLDSI